jgi:hypothetical protein
MAAVFNAAGLPRMNSKLSMIRFTLGLGLVALLTERYGITVAAAGIFAGYAVELAVRFWALRTIGVRRSRVLPGGVLVRLTLSYGATFVVCRVVTLAVPGTLSSLLVAIAAGAATFFGLVWTTDLLDERDRRAVASRLAGLVSTIRSPNTEPGA